MANNKILGNSGEEIAAGYLEREGYLVLQRNYRCKTGEIDIIARTAECIVFAEVKTRTSDLFGAPHEAVGRTKQNRIVKTALFYIQCNGLFDYMCRFDVIEVILDEESGEYNVNHIPDAFQYSGRYGY